MHFPISLRYFAPENMKQGNNVNEWIHNPVRVHRLFSFHFLIPFLYFSPLPLAFPSQMQHLDNRVATLIPAWLTAFVMQTRTCASAIRDTFQMPADFAVSDWMNEWLHLQQACMKVLVSWSFLLRIPSFVRLTYWIRCILGARVSWRSTNVYETGIVGELPSVETKSVTSST